MIEGLQFDNRICAKFWCRMNSCGHRRIKCQGQEMANVLHLTNCPKELQANMPKSSVSDSRMSTNLGILIFQILWKSRGHISVTYFSISFVKITFYTEILTLKVELWIFSLEKKATFLVKISV